MYIPAALLQLFVISFKIYFLIMIAYDIILQNEKFYQTKSNNDFSKLLLVIETGRARLSNQIEKQFRKFDLIARCAWQVTNAILHTGLNGSASDPNPYTADCIKFGANYSFLCFYIIGTHSNNVLICFTKRILGSVLLCPYNGCPK